MSKCKDSDIWDQKWPEIDSDAKVKLVFVDQDNEFIDYCSIERNQIDKMTPHEAYDLAKRSADFRKFRRTHEISDFYLKPIGDNLGLSLNFNARPLPDRESGGNGRNFDDDDEEEDEEESESGKGKNRYKKQKAKNKNC
uniref:Uncharacterized protein n=1 Tax=Romanomermis culicivorax TaxID=13658 RepID=A0A915KPW2_ROMCU